MDGDSVGKGIIATVIILPLVTVANIILTAVGCISAFFIIRAVFGMLGSVGGKIGNKAKSFGREVKDEANRLGTERF